ncbi:N-6 DNA methylase [Flavobacterium sp.]|uniref:N-6 DNA methylase n=1 Tax=Flavobacterium sp. TaxID=239 RepID=UPI00286E1618|nr:N-6 DNA methylase [Flavobacterium sp.]
MSAIIEHINTKEIWQKSLGLLPTKFLPDSDQQYVMQNGQFNNFCIDFNNGFDVEKYRHFSWATDTNCFLNFDDQKIKLFRWDKPIVETLNTQDLTVEKITKLYKYIGSFTQPKQDSVVPLIINIFNQLRSATGDQNGFWALQSLLYLLSKSEDGETIDFKKWGLNNNIKSNLPQQFDNIFEDFQKKINTIPNTTKVILRHASGKLFQEAHYQAILSGQLDIYGVPEPSKSLKNKELNGVHFTPAFITRSIVEESFRDFNFDGITEVKILDPACGSGEFLKESLRQIIESNKFNGLIKIYGWDKSKTAVEVANFSLHFEKSQYPTKTIEIEIIEKDTLDEQNWGEFHFILMNPPFVSWERLESIDQEKVRASLEDFFSNKPNLASPFFYKALKSLKPNGVLGCVLPTSIFNADSYKILRDYASENFNIELIGKLGNLNLFYNAVVDAGIYVATRKKENNNNSTVLWADSSLNSTTDALRNLRIFQQSPNIPVNETNFSIYKSIYNKTNFPNLVSFSSYNLEKKINELIFTKKLIPIKSIFDVKQGTRTGANEIFNVDKMYFESLKAEEKKYFKPSVSNKAIKNGKLSVYNYLWFPYNFKRELILKTEDEVSKKVPSFYKVLKHHQPTLENRSLIEKWWGLSRVYKWLCENNSKLVSTEFGKAGYFAIDTTGEYKVERGNAWSIKKSKSINQNEEDLNFAYLAFFCSEFFNKLLALYSKQIAGGQYYLGGKFVNDIPIPDLTLEENIGLANELISYGKRISDSGINEEEKILLNKIIESVYQS